MVREFLISTSSVNSGFILCTFTRKAAEELQFRLFNEIEPGLIAGRPYLIDTIHSISLSLLKLHPEGKYAEFDVIPDDQQASYINGQLPRLGFDRDEYKGHELWNLCASIANIYAYITDREIILENFDFKENQTLEIISSKYVIYRKLLNRDSRFDFATVQSTLYFELETNPEFKEIIDKNYGAFFVDEYQDTNQIQHNLLLRLTKPNFNFTVVGDDDQSIYGFRGADVSNLLEFPNFLKENSIPYEIEYLTDNYRSVSEIVSLGRNFINKSGIAGFSKNIQSPRGKSSVFPKVIEFDEMSAEASAVAAAIESLIATEAVVSFSQIAILLRSTKNRAHVFSQELQKKNIPFKMIGIGDFFDLVFIQEFMEILSYIVNPSTDALDVFSSNLVDINKSIQVYYFSEEVILNIIGIKDKWRSYRSSIAITYDILYAGNFFERYSQDGPSLGKLTQIVMSHDENIKGLDLFGLISYMSYLRREKLVDVESNNDQDAVQIMTLHKAKGLEFDAVFMPSQNEINPKSDLVQEFREITGIVGDNFADEIRLFYVGITRARNYLWISRSRLSPRGRKTYFPSLGFKLVQSSKDFYLDDLQFKKSDAIQATPHIISQIPVLSYNSIYSYQLCPKQYMYRNVWRLETARNAGLNYGANLHNALQMINAELAKGTESSLIDLNQIFNLAWKPNWRSSESENLKFRNTAINQIKIYLSKFDILFDGYEIAGIEKQFDVTIDEVLITGRFDLVLKKESSYLIVDFKTGDPRDYSFQMNFYEYCLRHENQQELVESNLYYMKSGELVEPPKMQTELIKASISETKNNLDKQIFNPKPGIHCTDCAFNEICDESSTKL